MWDDDTSGWRRHLGVSGCEPDARCEISSRPHSWPRGVDEWRSAVSGRSTSWSFSLKRRVSRVKWSHLRSNEHFHKYIAFIFCSFLDNIYTYYVYIYIYYIMYMYIMYTFIYVVYFKIYIYILCIYFINIYILNCIYI